MIGVNEEPSSRELVVFVSSNRADPYVNVLTNLRHPLLSSIHFIGIREQDSSRESMMESRVGAVVSKVGSLFELLAHGKYETSKGEVKSVVVSKEWRAIYSQCLNNLEMIPTTSLVIPWAELDKELARFVARKNVMFDVTTLKKNLLVDVVALLLSRGYIKVYSFELIREQKYDERDLIHSLGPDDYRYRGLAESRHIATARNRMIKRSVTFRGLLIAIAPTAAVVFAAQFFFDKTWLQGAVLALATVASIAGFLFLLLRADR